MANGIVPWVFMGQRRDNCFREKRSRRLIRERAPIIAGIASESMAQFRIRPQSHALAGLQSRPNERGIVHAILPGQREFVSHRQRRELGVSAYGRKIRDDPKHAFGLFASGIIRLLAGWDRSRRRSQRRLLI